MIGVRLRTARALGFANIARVLGYRLQLRAGIHPAQRLPAAVIPTGPLFDSPASPRALPVSSAWRHEASYFGWYRQPLGDAPPDWHRNPFEARRPYADADWWRIPDFDPLAGDIKAIWEASRLDWALSLAQRGAAGDAAAIERLNAWICDWSAHNACYRGHNWKCAQETSIRVMHLALAALILEVTAAPREALVALLEAHLRRIDPTLSYATAQDNNHGTSEAAALFIGGSWLHAVGRSDGRRWAARGRRLLEERAARLIQPDGSFSQYSITYHRLMLETLSLVEVWRRRLGLAEFSARYRARCVAASDWMRAMVDPASGDAPNYGANDGAHLLPLTDAGYRDFRPAVQLATALFEDRAAFTGPGPWQTQLAWLGVALPAAAVPAPGSARFDDGGQAVLRAGPACAVLIYPRYRFRPSHADPLHLDLWLNGENLLRDGGSFSYAAPIALQDELTGIRGHNTVQFDGREPMPRLGRFLWGDWLRTESVTPPSASGDTVAMAAAYRDRAGARHQRVVELSPQRLEVRDRVAGFVSRAVLRWRLRPGPWRVEGHTVTDGAHRLDVAADVAIVRFELAQGWESRYYLQRSAIPVLEVEVTAVGTLTSRYAWT